MMLRQMVNSADGSDHACRGVAEPLIRLGCRCTEEPLCSFLAWWLLRLRWVDDRIARAEQ
jgi:hypothetical protein